MTKTRFYEEKKVEDLQERINGFVRLNNYEIVNVSLTTRIIGYSNYVVACVVYKEGET